MATKKWDPTHVALASAAKETVERLRRIVHQVLPDIIMSDDIGESERKELKGIHEEIVCLVNLLRLNLKARLVWDLASQDAMSEAMDRYVDMEEIYPAQILLESKKAVS